MDWKPIETAPKDGSLILIYIDYCMGHHDRQFVAAKWNATDGRWKEDAYPHGEADYNEVWGEEWATYWTELTLPPDCPLKG